MLLLPAMEARRAEQYDAMAVHHASVTCIERKSLGTTTVRYMNNFVKACMIDTACRTLVDVLPELRTSGLVVADIACGRGQDVGKWKFGAAAAGTFVRTFYGMDLSVHDCNAAEAQVARFMARATTAHTIHAANMGTDAFELPDASVHVLSCQLALHYLCDALGHVQHFFAQAARVLHPAGLLLVSFADGRAVVRRGRNAVPPGYVVQQFYTLEMDPAVLRARLPSPFGHPYMFTLDGSVHRVAEYLCHEGAVCAAAAEAGGFREHISKPFDVLARFLREQRRFAAIAEKMDGCGFENPAALPATLDAANLYRFIVMSTQHSNAAAFTAHLQA